jgi:immune inhibitor A
MTSSPARFVQGIHDIHARARANDDGTRCCVAPSPELQARMREAVRALRADAPDAVRNLLTFRREPRVGFDDGLIIPGTLLPLGTPPAVARAVALERAPLRGVVNVVVVLVEFTDRAFGAASTPAHFHDLFFSTGVIPTGSVREYYTEVTNGLITISGEVVGPFTMPHTLAHYANGASGIGNASPNSRDLARDAAMLADPQVDFSNYDNNQDGFVDAYVIVHAGSGAEQTGAAGDIWSHKWVLPSAMSADGVQLFAYLTVPEDSRIGVCAHELGHLLFGFPDLYDTDGSSEGVGNWCLMGGGSWNGGGNRPAHPSAWCKANQGWATVTNVTANGSRTIADVKAGHEVLRLWKDGSNSQEYFLVENRQRSGFDDQIPAGGLLVWHVDDAVATNSNDAHPKVALEQADGLNHLGTAANRGDGGDPYPGTANASVFDNNSTPNSKSYAGSDTCVALTNISASAPTMTAHVRVKCGLVKGFKEREKPVWREDRWGKIFIGEKGGRLPEKRPEKPEIDKSTGYEKPWDFDWRWRDFGGRQGDVEDRLARLEMAMSAVAGVQPFIDRSLRPDLGGSALGMEEDLDGMREQLGGQGSNDKRLMDVPGYRR